jgi:hypothetical protein
MHELISVRVVGKCFINAVRLDWLPPHRPTNLLPTKLVLPLEKKSEKSFGFRNCKVNAGNLPHESSDKHAAATELEERAGSVVDYRDGAPPTELFKMVGGFNVHCVNVVG